MVMTLEPCAEIDDIDEMPGTVDDDRLAASQSCRYHRASADRAVDCDRLHRGFAILHRKDKIAGLASLHGNGWYDDCVFGADRKLGGDERARPEYLGGVVHDP